MNLVTQTFISTIWNELKIGKPKSNCNKEKCNTNFKIGSKIWKTILWWQLSIQAHYNFWHALAGVHEIRFLKHVRTWHKILNLLKTWTLRLATKDERQSNLFVPSFPSFLFYCYYRHQKDCPSYCLDVCILKTL